MPYSLASDTPATPLIPVRRDSLQDWLEKAPPATRSWLQASGFKAAPGEFCLVPGSGGAIENVVFGMQEQGWLTQLGALATGLPAGVFRLDCDWTEDAQELAALGWGLGSYRFDRYKTSDKAAPTLELDETMRDRVQPLFDAQCLVRNLVNTPTEDLGPEELSDALIKAGKDHGASTSVIKGTELLDNNLPAIHIVGRAADRAPRLARLDWGHKDHPLVVLVGKGVCFDTGGLNMKPGAGMALMKKDMGGAAHVIALAQLIMQAELPVRLLVLVPAVENNIAGNAYRPGDVINTRAGKHIEIGNTDAEGRLVLCDALTLAMEAEPDLVLDFATLTGAARVALGPDLPPVFSNDPDLARDLVAAGNTIEDPLWELPLHKRYLDMIKSDIADLNNSGKGGFGGAITAALFLQEFVEADVAWAHIDTFAWAPAALPSRPVGGEALGLRAAFRYLEDRYSS